MKVSVDETVPRPPISEKNFFFTGVMGADKINLKDTRRFKFPVTKM